MQPLDGHVVEDLKTEIFRYLAAMWRRKWIGAAACWAICVGGWIAVMMIPNNYRATTRIYVDADSLLTPLLRGMAVDTDPARYLEFLRNTLLSRPNLEKVSHLADLGIDNAAPADKEAVLSELAADVQIIQSSSANLFTIAYADTNPVEARNVVQALLTIFSERNASDTRSDMVRAQQFINDEIARYEKLLREAEQRRADFRSKYVEILPGSDNSASRLETVRQSVTLLTGQLAEAVAKRNALKLELAAVPHFLSVDSAPQVIVSNGRSETPTERRLDEARRNLDLLRLRYTDKHPDVVSQQQLVTQLEQQVEAERKAGTSAGGDDAAAKSGSASRRSQVTNAVYEQLQVRLVDMESTVASLERHLADAKTELARDDEIAHSVPGIEAKAKDLDRDYEVIKHNFEELLQRRESAQLSAAANIKADKIQFRIIDPPQVPLEPFSPNRTLLISVVLLVGMAAGIVAPFVFTQLDASFNSVSHLRALGFYVLGGVTRLPLLTPRRRSPVSLLLFFTCSVLLLVAYEILINYNDILLLKLKSLTA